MTLTGIGCSTLVWVYNLDFDNHKEAMWDKESRAYTFWRAFLNNSHTNISRCGGFCVNKGHHHSLTKLKNYWIGFTSLRIGISGPPILPLGSSKTFTYNCRCWASHMMSLYVHWLILWRSPLGNGISTSIAGDTLKTLTLTNRKSQHVILDITSLPA